MLPYLLALLACYIRFDSKDGRRMVCFSTNIAESGVTLPGVTAVVDTGRELFFAYDLELKANVITTSWVSKASQQQRKGRAGRTAPGVCVFCESCRQSRPSFGNSGVKSHL